ncbi:MAG: hypothetical protein K6T81_11635 [Alicyclobacillus macrosporangiidus]|uniref:hypothetical protein n=1 Tax=Alicyclobacillus macrosporangiidus TaxID=392015 RepID=UPI0026E92F06|nr:hypothetical protein [Alicyclobacillus macrosporangiidus]MCL6599377.1 hypothetical protein [Alicyclobacillus macrosporangiidus]
MPGRWCERPGNGVIGAAWGVRRGLEALGWRCGVGVGSRERGRFRRAWGSCGLGLARFDLGPASVCHGRDFSRTTWVPHYGTTFRHPQ